MVISMNIGYDTIITGVFCGLLDGFPADGHLRFWAGGSGHDTQSSAELGITFLFCLSLGVRYLGCNDVINVISGVVKDGTSADTHSHYTSGERPGFNHRKKHVIRLVCLHQGTGCAICLPQHV